MKCPRCGSEMTLDSHRKIPLNMCYECGYIEGRTLEDEPSVLNNYVHLKKLTLDDTAAFLSKGLKQQGINVEKSVIANWLLEAYTS